MASRQTHAVLRFIRQIATAQGPGALPDRELLERFLTQRDEVAFATLVQRHGPLVLGVCRRVLHHRQDAEDAFQTTFLVLVRKAGSIVRRESLSSWLYGVASRIALKSRTRAARRREQETEFRDLPAFEPPRGLAGNDFGPVLDEEVNRLPDKYRVPLVLCYLEGKTTAEAARQVGCPRGTVLSRLARARERLRLRLAHRGFALPAALSAIGLAPSAASTAVPAVLAASTVKAALALAAGAAVGGMVSVKAIALAKGTMQAMFMTKLRIATAVLLAASVLGAGAGLLTHHAWAGKSGDEPRPERVAGDADAVRLPAGAAARLGIGTAEARPRKAPRPRLLHLSGSTALDPQRLARVRCPLAGEVIEIAKVRPGSEVRPGSAVKKGDVLAVVRSKDLAEKKHELVDALVQLHLDREILARAEKAADTVPEVVILTARRNVQSDSNAVRRVERALRAWDVSEEEIKTLEEYADGLGRRKGERDPEKEKAWGRVTLRSPFDGVIVERNVVLHEILRNPTTNLFQIAQVDRLLVIANVPEGELPTLNALRPEERVWSVRPVGAAAATELKGPIEEISYLIDPNQHTAVIKGYIDNAEGRLRAGQFITATVVLPTELVLPASALVEVGRETIVFIQLDPVKPIYVQRHVVVVRRGHDMAHVRFPWKPGERVVTVGALDLKAALDDLKAERK
jgi:cobalt-zinc-cadmium efflux system membrane fusion protein